MRNVLEEGLEKIETHILYSITFFSKIAPFEVMSKNVVETKRPQTTPQYGAYELHAG
jgi:hypothetical protein